MTDDLVLRPLDIDDREAVQALLDADPGYATRVTGRPPGPGDALGLLNSRPPGPRRGP